MSLADAADVIVIAPATADIIAKLAAGIADELILSTVLAAKAPVIVVPAMDVNMYENAVTQENITKLKARNFTFVEPEFGRMASGKIGRGRFPEKRVIIGTINKVLGRAGDLAGKRFVITAGGTQTGATQSASLPTALRVRWVTLSRKPPAIGERTSF